MIDDFTPVEPHRVMTGPMRSERGCKYGGFIFIEPKKIKFLVMVGNGMGWEHISISKYRGYNPKTHKPLLPNWYDMCRFKKLFFKPEEVVMQLHPAENDEISFAEVLHLWRPKKQGIPLPPKEMV